MPEIMRAGSRGLLVQIDDPHAIERVLNLRGGATGYLIEYAVPAMRSVLVVATQEEFLPAVRALIQHVLIDRDDSEAAQLRPPREHVIPTRYGGEDLDEAADLCGLSRREFVRAHAASIHRVAFFGFAPGFAYLEGSDPRLALPRRPNPRKSIAAGMVAVAAQQSVVYPGGTPGGWHLIGHTGFVSWDLTNDPPTPFAVGDTVVFEPVGPMP